MPDPDSLVFVYTTAPSQAEAELIADAVLAAGHAACVNMLPGMQSMYMWEGKLQRDDEVALLFKACTSTYKAAMHRIAAVHPYDTPAITAFNALDADPRFAAWVTAETE